MPGLSKRAGSYRSIPLHHDIDDPVRHDDDLARRLAFHRALDRRLRQRDRLGIGLAAIARQFDRGTQLAVHLHGDGHGVLDNERGIEFGPRLVGEQPLVAERPPQLFGQMSRTATSSPSRITAAAPGPSPSSSSRLVSSRIRATALLKRNFSICSVTAATLRWMAR